MCPYPNARMKASKRASELKLFEYGYGHTEKQLERAHSSLFKETLLGRKYIPWNWKLGEGVFHLFHLHNKPTFSTNSSLNGTASIKCYIVLTNIVNRKYKYANNNFPHLFLSLSHFGRNLSGWYVSRDLWISLQWTTTTTKIFIITIIMFHYIHQRETTLLLSIWITLSR